MNKLWYAGTFISKFFSTQLRGVSLLRIYSQSCISSHNAVFNIYLGISLLGAARLSADFSIYGLFTGHALTPMQISLRASNLCVFLRSSNISLYSTNATHISCSVNGLATQVYASLGFIASITAGLSCNDTAVFRSFIAATGVSPLINVSAFNSLLSAAIINISMETFKTSVDS